MERKREKTGIFITGLAMGLAEVIPGVSGGTVAFIAGIYERLIRAFHQLRPEILKGILRNNIRAVWADIDGLFLVILFLGMGVGILSFANGVSYLLHHHPVFIWSFFFGLVIASCVIVSRQISNFSGSVISSASAGLLIGITITNLIPLQLEPTPLTLFVGGSIAVCAWILPGMSGSFILLILGLYAYVIDAVKAFDLASLIWLGCGCVVGLMAFSQILARLFNSYKDNTLALLTGFMAGSLFKLWPWKFTQSYQLKRDGSQIPLEEGLVFPWEYEAVTGLDPQTGWAVGIILSGIVLVTLIDMFWVLGQKQGIEEGQEKEKEGTDRDRVE